jgi:hypothetical protein
MAARVAARLAFAIAAGILAAILALTYSRPDVPAIAGAALFAWVAFACMRLVCTWRPRPDDGSFGEEGGGGGGGPPRPEPPSDWPSLDWGQFDHVRERWERTPARG